MKNHWLSEADVFLTEAARHFTPAMRQKFDLEWTFATALRLVRRTGEPPVVPHVLNKLAGCPFTLDELVRRDGPDLQKLLARFAD